MQNFSPISPYNDLPDLPPEVEIENKTILKKCIQARTALSELKVTGRLIPNQSALINTIPILESKDSSQIENIVTSTDNLFRYSFHNLHMAPDAPTKEALRYRAALNKGFNSLNEKPLSISTAIEVCSIIKGHDVEVRKVPGTILLNSKTNETIYTPPVGEELLQNKLSNWEKFLHNYLEIDPLIRMAVAHYQFEAIHPFTDGNGRTGRILNLLFLISENLLDKPILYLSKFILENRQKYYDFLQQVTHKGKWEQWILFLLEGVIETSNWTINLINQINELIDKTIVYFREELPKIYSREIVDIIFHQPYCRISNFVDKGIAKRETCSQYLQKMCKAGILKEIKMGKDKVFVNDNFLNLLSGSN